MAGSVPDADPIEGGAQRHPGHDSRAHPGLDHALPLPPVRAFHDLRMHALCDRVIQDKICGRDVLHGAQHVRRVHAGMRLQRPDRGHLVRLYLPAGGGAGVYVFP